MGSGFLESLMYRDYSPIGVDIGHDSIKMLQLRRRSGGWDVTAGGVHLFGDDVRGNPSLRWGQVSGAIRTLLGGSRRTGFRGRRVVLSLDCQQALIKNARLPKMPPEELDEAVRWEAHERFPFDVGAGLVRHLVAGEVRQGGEQRHEVLMFAVESQILHDALQLVEDAGCQPVGLDAQPLALARAADFFMPADGDPDTVQALADLGSHSCQLVIRRAGRVVFVKSIDIGSQDLTRAVIEKVGTSLEDTHALRLRLGRGEGEAAHEDSKVYRAVTAAMRPVVERLAQEITLCLRYYSVTFRGNRPDRVVFVGGASHDQMLMHLVDESLGLKAETGRPLALCNPPASVCQWGGGLSGGGPEWAVALGCCLKPVVRNHRSAAPANAVPPIAEPVAVGEPTDLAAPV